MYVLLKDTDNVNDAGMYLYTPSYDRSVERSLIELYYRGVAEGLVDCAVVEVCDTSANVVDIADWIDAKRAEGTTGRVTELLDLLRGKLAISH